jgi:hypothetical protein
MLLRGDYLCNACKALEEFSARLRDEIDLDPLGDD